MKKLIVFILALILILGLLWLLTDLWSRNRLDAACKEWPLLGKSLGDLLQLYPQTSMNHAAKALEELYRQVRPDMNSDTNMVFREYLEKELGMPTGVVEAPSADIAAILTKNEDVLVDIAHLLGSDTLPKWGFTVPTEAEPVVHYNLWYLRLHRLLMAQAFLFHANGDHARAWSNLFASARLADSLFTHPHLIPQLIAVLQAQEILLAMRKMPAPIPAWALSWPTHDLEHGMLLAYTTEAWMQNGWVIADASFLSMLQTMNPLYVERGRKPVPLGIRTHLFSLIGRPYIRLCAAHKLVAWKQMISNRWREGLCVDQPSGFGTFEEQFPSWTISSWSLVGKILDADLADFWGWETSLDSSWYRLHRLMVYLTGTRGILAAKTAKATSPTGRWPDTLSGIALPCERLAWSYTIASDGSVTFQYAQSLPTLLPEVPVGYLTYIGSAEE